MISACSIYKTSLWFAQEKWARKGCLSTGSSGAWAQYGESCLQPAGTPMGRAALAVSVHLNWELSLHSESVQLLPVSPVQSSSLWRVSDISRVKGIQRGKA